MAFFDGGAALDDAAASLAARFVAMVKDKPSCSPVPCKYVTDTFYYKYYCQSAVERIRKGTNCFGGGCLGVQGNGNIQ